MQSFPAVNAAHPTQALISVENLKENLRWAADRVRPAKVIPVVKDNAYGHGSAEIAGICESCGVETLAVAFVDEALELRRRGIKADLLVMGSIPEDRFGEVVEHSLLPTVVSVSQLETLESLIADSPSAGKFPVHLKFDTGMGRIGFPWEDAGQLCEKLGAFAFIRLAGIYSHYACADTPEHPLNALQRQRYETVIRTFSEAGYQKFERHLSNSAGVLFFPESNYDAVRMGITFYGLSPSVSPLKFERVKPVMSLRTRLNFVKRLPAGVPVSYGATWRTPSNGTVGTVPIGYGDGFSRSLSGGKGVFEWRGKRYDVAGRVCMDSTMVDMENECPENGDEIRIFGWGCRSGAEDFAGILDTVPHEIVAGISRRVARIYV